MNQQIQNRLIKLLEESEGIQGVKETDTFENLNMDSLEVAHFEVIVERDFGITQTDSWANPKDTVSMAAARFTKIYERESRKQEPGE